MLTRPIEQSGRPRQRRVAEHRRANPDRGARKHPDFSRWPSRCPHPPGPGAQGPVMEQDIATERAVVQASRAALAPGLRRRKRSTQHAAVEAKSSPRGRPRRESVGTRTILDVLECRAGAAATRRSHWSPPARRLCRRLPAPERDGPGRSGGSRLDGGSLYDPLGNYRRVANNWNDWATDPPISRSRPAPSAPRKCPPIRA